MTITFRITLPCMSTSPEVKQLMHDLRPLAATLLLTAVDASGVGLPVRLLLHAAVHVAQGSAGEAGARAA
ncbi:hypothetical protein [Streptomyces sp.]|uniref:hypothetical protein n=1 Tax=Streptomyces sp. TaxID=1931 RepID=UPI002F3E9166